MAAAAPEEEYSMPDWVKGSPYIIDDWSKHVEPIRRYREDFPPFLWTGRKPQVGMRVETQVSFTEGRWCYMSGYITDVGPEPTDNMLRQAGKEGLSMLFMPDVSARDTRLYIGAIGCGPFGFEPIVKVTDENRDQHFQETKNLCKEYLGALHGQTLKGYGMYTNPSEYSLEDLGLGFSRDRKFCICICLLPFVFLYLNVHHPSLCDRGL